MATIIINDRAAKTATGQNLLKVARRQNAHIGYVCNGQGFCSTCESRVLAGAEFLNRPTATERKWLPANRIRRGYRLACQTVVTGDGTIRILTRAEEMRRQALAILRPGKGQNPLGALQLLSANLTGTSNDYLSHLSGKLSGNSPLTPPQSAPLKRQIKQPTITEPIATPPSANLAPVEIELVNQLAEQISVEPPTTELPKAAPSVNDIILETPLVIEIPAATKPPAEIVREKPAVSEPLIAPLADETEPAIKVELPEPVIAPMIIATRTEPAITAATQPLVLAEKQTVPAADGATDVALQTATQFAPTAQSTPLALNPTQKPASRKRFRNLLIGVLLLLLAFLLGWFSYRLTHNAKD